MIFDQTPTAGRRFLCNCFEVDTAYLILRQFEIKLGIKEEVSHGEKAIQIDLIWLNDEVEE